MKLKTSSPAILAMEQAKDPLCISIIVPTKRNDAMNKENSIKLKNAVENAKDQLIQRLGKRNASRMIENLDDLYSHVHMKGHKDGVGLYVSDKMKMEKIFPFPVKEKIVIGDSYEVRDLIVEEQYSDPYYLLVFSQTAAKLFQGKLDKLEETTDENFPKQFKDDYEYQHPSPASSYSGSRLEKGLEKDKSIIVEIRVQRFINDIDKHLDHYLSPDNSLFVVAEEKNIGYFREISRHKKNVHGEIHGSYINTSATELGELVWPEVKKYLDSLEENMIRELHEMPTGRVEAGLINCWRAVAEGRGLRLLIETDHSRPAYFDADGLTLTLEEPQNRHTFLVDAVDDLAEKAEQMNTEVRFVQNGKLSDYEQVGLTTRY